MPVNQITFPNIIQSSLTQGHILIVIFAIHKPFTLGFEKIIIFVFFLVDCSFENTLCAWSNTGNDDTDWLPRTGKHPPGLHGPITDHTLGSAKGKYFTLYFLLINI